MRQTAPSLVMWVGSCEAAVRQTAPSLVMWVGSCEADCSFLSYVGGQL